MKGVVLAGGTGSRLRSEEHTSELQSRLHLVCRLLLEKKKKHQTPGRAEASGRQRTRYSDDVASRLRIRRPPVRRSLRHRTPSCRFCFCFFFFLIMRPPPRSPLFPYTPLFR